MADLKMAAQSCTESKMKKILTAALIGAVSLSAGPAFAGKNGLFHIERFYNENGRSKAIISVNVPSDKYGLDGSCAFLDERDNILDVTNVFVTASGWQTVYGPYNADGIH